MSLTFNMSVNLVLSPVFSVDLALIATFVSQTVCCSAASDYSTHFSFFFYAILQFFLFICLIIIMSYYLIISNLLSFNVYFTPNWWLEHVSQGPYAITLSLCKNEVIFMLI